MVEQLGIYPGWQGQQPWLIVKFNGKIPAILSVLVYQMPLPEDMYF